MREITFEAKMNVLELYVKGFSTNDIVGKRGISKGAVVSIINDAREGRFPGLQLKGRIDELHDLSVRLRKGGIDLPQARLGFTFLERLWELGVEPDTLKGWIEFCSQVSPDSPEGFIPAAMELYRIEKETGMVYSDIVSRVQDLSTERDRLLQEVGGLQAKERRANELKLQIKEDEGSVEKLMAEKGRLEIGVMKGRYEKEIEDMEWGIMILPFLAHPGQVGCCRHPMQDFACCLCTGVLGTALVPSLR